MATKARASISGPDKRLFQRPSLFLSFLKNGRVAANMVVNHPRQRRPPPGNEPGQRFSQQAGQGDNRRIGKQVAQKRLDRFRTVWSAQIEQYNPKLHSLTFIRTLILKVMMKMLFVL